MVSKVSFTLIIYRSKHPTVIISFSFFKAEKHRPCMEILKECQRAGPVGKVSSYRKIFQKHKCSSFKHGLVPKITCWGFFFFHFNININCHCVTELQTHLDSGIFILKYFSVNKSHLTKQKDFVTVCVF